MTRGEDQYYMAQALRLAENGLYTTQPNPRVGCVLVKDGAVVGTGWHYRTGEAHAEIHALEQAGNKAAGATAYISLEPCCHQGRTGPCTQALIKAGVGRVVIALLDPNPLVAGNGLQQISAAGINTSQGVLQQQAEELNPGFIQRMRHGRPWVCCKLAVSLDGHTAMDDGESQWITGEQARLDVHHWRARSSAILTGVGTVLSDNPSLNVRLPNLDKNSFVAPLRIILDSHLKTPIQARCLSLPGRTVICTTSTDKIKQQALIDAGAELIVLEPQEGKIDLQQLMRQLAVMEINEVLVEAGAKLNGALLEAGLMDQSLIYMAPHIMGSQTKPMLITSGIHSMKDRVDMSISEIRAVGKDWRITAKPNRVAL